MTENVLEDSFDILQPRTAMLKLYEGKTITEKHISYSKYCIKLRFHR